MEREIVVERNVLIPMRDGARLAADSYHPEGDGPWPAIVSVYPYHKDDGDVGRVRATEEMTAQMVELRSIVTVNDEERYRGEWRRPWRAP